MERYALVILAGIFGGLAAQRCHVPGGAVVGAMLASGLVTLLLPEGINLPKQWGTIIQIVLGVSLGMTFDRSFLPIAAKAMPLAILSTVILLLVAIGMAFLASRLGLVDFGTALFGFSPGGMTGMAVISQVEGHNSAVVAFFHLVRVFTLFMTVPLLARIFFMIKQSS